MSANQSNPGNPPLQKPISGQNAKSDPNAQPQAKTAGGNPSLSAQDEYMKTLLEKMVQENPAGIAEIIHLWLSEDKKRNE